MSLIGFERSMPRVLVYEGGYSKHPKDPGGATYQGVTQRSYDGARAMNNQPPRDVRKMTEQERNAIYQFFYWDAVHGDVMPLGVDFVLFDGAVNSGPRRSVMWFQQALGDLYPGAVDGHIGPVTCAAVMRVNDHDALVARMLERRLQFLHELRTWPTFGKGWNSRVTNVKQTGQAWATGSVDCPDPFFAKGGNVKTPTTIIETTMH